MDQVDAALVKSYADDLRSLLEESELTECKAFLRSFIERIDVDGSEATIRYRLPLPQGGKTHDRISVLPIDTFLVGLSGQFPNSCLRSTNSSLPCRCC